MDAENDEAIKLEKNEIKYSYPRPEPHAALAVDDQQDKEQAAGDQRNESRHDGLPMSSGVGREGTGKSNSEGGQAKLNSIYVWGFILESQVVHEKIGKDQHHPDGETGLGIAMVESLIVSNKILFIGVVGK